MLSEKDLFYLGTILLMSNGFHTKEGAETIAKEVYKDIFKEENIQINE